MMNDEHDMEHKKSVLMDLLSKMKELQAGSLKGSQDESEDPHGMALEVHEAHAEPLNQEDVEKLEEATHTDLDNDNEEGEPEAHKEMVLGHDDEDMEEPSDNEEEMEPEAPMHPGLAALLAEHMKRK